MSKYDITGMSRADLVVLQGEVKAALRACRPYRIRERLIRCGKLGCWCSKRDKGHGPYLSVVYRAEGKTKSVSIGPKLSIDEMMEARPAFPEIANYLNVPDHEYLDMPRWQTLDWVYMTLTPQSFVDRYGVTQEEDNFGRPSKFWGPRSEYDRFNSEYSLVVDRRDVPYNGWSGYGVSTLGGIAILEALEARNYYLKP